MRSFASDNRASVHPAIMEAIAKANTGHAPAYGHDALTQSAIHKFKEHFGSNVDVHFVFTGTAANVLGLRAVTQSFNAVICADCSHLNTDECGAAENFLGCKLLAVPPTRDGKLAVQDIEKHLPNRNEHRVQAKALTLSQATEWGTVYTPAEIAALAGAVHQHGMLLHMDGARLCNAAARLNVSLKTLSADAGVDILSFGGTKNGLMFGEAVLFFNPALSENFKYIRKQGMQLGSKLRFLAAQFEAFLSNDLWLKNAQHSNRMAQLLYERVRSLPGIEIVAPVEANAIFARLPFKSAKALQEKSYFYFWNERDSIVRWMTAFDTTPEDVDAFVELIKRELSAH